MSHEAAVRSALKMNREMGLIMSRLGSSERPRGPVLAAYRNALRALRSVLASTSSPSERAWRVAEVLRSLRLEVALAVQAALEDAARLGAQQAALQLAAYGVGGAPTDAPQTTAAEGLAVVLALVDQQIASAMALAATGADPALIVGSNDRQGPVQPAPVLGSAWFWVGAATLAGWLWIASRPREPFLRQAVAAIDERTTDCCLRVHGQVQPMDERFHLTGRPRFAEYVMAPPFHWNCRSALALVRPEDVGDDLTAQMQAAARAELDARERTGGRQEIHPASAVSRR